MAKQVLGKSLEASQPDGVFKPACLSGAVEIHNCPVWGKGWGTRLVANRNPQESRGRNSGFEDACELILSQCCVSALLQIWWERRVIYKFAIYIKVGDIGCGLTSP